MSCRPRFSGFAFLPLILGVSLASAASATPDLARCAAIEAADARLACYDALAGRAPAAAAATQRPGPATAAVPTAAPVAGTAAPAAPQGFGLSSIPKQEAPAAPTSIEALVTSVSADASGHLHVVLDNDQTWVFTEPEGDARLHAGDKVTIKRASLGSFLMLTPLRYSYRVHRTR